MRDESSLDLDEDLIVATRAFTWQHLAPAAAVVAGVFHALAMALRKFYGAGNYLLQPGWWAGCLADGIGGIVFTLASPLLAVQIFVPLTAVSQLSAAYAVGFCFFGEESSVRRHAGFALSVISVVILSMVPWAEGKAIEGSFWTLWLQPHFLVVSVGWLLLIAVLFAFFSDEDGSALLSALFDGVQFLFSRTLALNVEAAGGVLSPHSAEMFAGKMICALLVLHFQQRALHAELSRMGALLPLMQNLTTASLGLSFFGDAVEVTPPLVIGMLLAAVGFWSLSERQETGREAEGLDEGSKDDKQVDAPEDASDKTTESNG
eukprot:gb/GFBE01071963.1/.p1 GENE.gb/GFBE01071963.1/~~gb/GFBE01071963.1/.p1  ORF type:complete len:319 (+),score=68.53 gb/GFBE01071963.1/:1-957(+)